MKVQRIMIVVLLAAILASCVGTTEQITRYGTYTYKGVEYDAYNAVVNNGEGRTPDFIRFLVPKGTKLTDVAGAEFVRCYTTLSVGNDAKCNKKFGQALERRLNPAQGQGSDSMY